MEEFEKKFELIKLFDIYGVLLTEKQQQILKSYLLDDLNFLEIAENEGISKQAVGINIGKSKEKLEFFEKNLCILSDKKSIKLSVEKIISDIKDKKVDLGDVAFLLEKLKNNL